MTGRKVVQPTISAPYRSGSDGSWSVHVAGSWDRGAVVGARTSTEALRLARAVAKLMKGKPPQKPRSGR